MVGTIALFDKEGERQFTLYTAAAPEYGKKTFLQRLDNEVSKMKERYPTAHFVSLADGARDNWDFPETRTDTQIIDFYHVFKQSVRGHVSRQKEPHQKTRVA